MADDPSDPLVALRAQLDQISMVAPEVAALARSWFDAFKARGFADNQACYLTAVELLQNPGVAPA